MGADDDALAETASIAPAVLEETWALSGPDFADFVVERRLGSGGMGVVYLAHDTTLDRRVAIKLIRSDASGMDRLRARFLREARALSKVTHPNVVTVHSAGLTGDQVYIVMEYVDGGTLAEYLTEKKRSRREIVDVLLQAGRGLAAVHRAGLIHRDFKPSNVLVGQDGRARVTDFGLAAFTAAPTEEPDRDAPSSPSPGLTARGAILGTPLYMAPEQHHASAVGPAADQFAFGVTLYEALADAHPYQGETPEELRAHVLGQKARPLPDRIPAWLRAIVHRALERDPARRFPSMDELLAALARGPRVTPGRVAVAAIAAAAVAGIGWGAVASRRDPPCQGAGAALASVWGDAQRKALGLAFGKSKLADASEVAARLTGQLDGYAAAWTAMRTDACQATAIRREQSEAVLDLRMGCLDRRLAELQAVADVLSSAENITPLAPRAPQSLGPLAECADVTALAATTPAVPKERRLEYNAQVVKLAQLHVLASLGNRLAAQKQGTGMIDEARRLGVPSALAQTLYIAVELQDEDPAALGWLEEALAIAADTRDDRLIALIQIRMIFLLGVKQTHYAEAMALWPVAAAAVRRVGNPDRLQAQLLNHVGGVQLRAGRTDEAIRTTLEGRRRSARGWGETSLEVATSDTALAEQTSRAGRWEEARRHAENAIAILDQQLGPNSYDSGRAHNELGGMASRQGDFAAARRHYQRAHDIMVLQMGERSPPVALLLMNLAEVDEAEGNFDDAGDKLRRALAMLEKRMGPGDLRTGWVARDLARVLLDQGKPAEARPLAEQALAAHEKLGPDHPELGETLLVVGPLFVVEKEPGKAVATLERALAIFDKTTDPLARRALAELGKAYLAAGRAADALRVLERAAALLVANMPAAEAAEARFALARALRASGRDPERARALAGEARAAFAGTARPAQVAEVDRWLAR